MIEGYIGLPGKGKTLSMTVRAYKERKYYHEIISNYGLSAELFAPCPIVQIQSAQHFVDITMRALYEPDGKSRLFLLDEVHAMLDARNWTKVPQEALMVLAQPRKARMDVLYTAQHESQVEKRLKVVTNYLWLCKAWGADLNPFSDAPLWFWSKCYESFEFRSPRAKEYGGRIYRFKKKWGELYDTMQVLERMTFDGVGTLTSQAAERV